MLKSVAKTVLISVGAVLFAFSAAVVSYSITKNSYETKLYAVKNQNAATPANAGPETKNPTAEVSAEDIPIDYYVVRLEGESLNVYALQRDTEEFLYNERICITDLNQADRDLLSAGVTLETSEALTGFIENFTS